LDSVRETLRRSGFFSGDFERCVKRALEMEHLSSCRGSIRGTWLGGSYSGDFERYAKRALEIEHLSLCRGSIRGTWWGGRVLFWRL
jgi:hypothetical protein